MTLAVSFSMIVFIRPRASATPMIDATVVFLVRAMSTEPSGAMAPRNAWGRITSRSDWAKVRPIDAGRLGLARGHGVDAERSASQTKAAW